MIERFVELAQKHAPEFSVEFWRPKIVRLARCKPNIYHSYMEGEGPFSSAEFTITLLEYLKGLAEPYQEWIRRNPYAGSVPKHLWGSSRADDAMDRTWDTLTPEAVMQACIDVWEAME